MRCSREIEHAADLGFHTLVIGTPGSALTEAGTDARPWLSRAARIGQGNVSWECNDDGPDYCHLDTSTSDDPALVISDFLKRAYSVPSWDCLLPIGESTRQLLSSSYDVSVVVTTASGVFSLRRSTTSDCQTGFRELPDSGDIELCPSTCARLADLGTSQLAIYFSCH
ncbi:MAG: hypothetical protein QM756_26095 [Polyangiaceae bacterium]